MTSYRRNRSFVTTIIAISKHWRRGKPLLTSNQKEGDRLANAQVNTIATNPTPKKPWMTLRRKNMLIAYGFVVVPLLFFLAIRIFPTLYAFGMSFETEEKDPFYANYIKMMSDPVFWKAMINTLLYVIITVPLQMAIGLGLALLIQHLNKGKGIYRFIYFIPYVTSAVAVSWVWRYMYFKDLGLFNEILKFFHIPIQPFLTHPSQALMAVAVTIVWQAVGFSMLIFLAGLESIPKLYYEAASIDGANKRNTFFRITFPLLNPTIVFLAVTGVINSLQTFTQVINMTGSDVGAGGPLNSTLTLVVYIFNTAFLNFDMAYGTAMTVILFLIILLITIIQLRLFSRTIEH